MGLRTRTIPRLNGAGPAAARQAPPPPAFSSLSAAPLLGVFVAGNLFHGSTGQNGFVVLPGTDRIGVGAALNQEPFLFAVVLAATGSDQRPVALKLFAAEMQRDLAVLIGLGWSAFTHPVGADVPNHDRAAAVLSGGNGPFESSIIERVIFHMHG